MTNTQNEQLLIKDYIIKYQGKYNNNRQRLMDDLVFYPVREIIKSENNEHHIKHLEFNDKLMNGWLISVKKEYGNIIPREDIEDAVIDFILLNSTFDNADINKSAQEIASFVNKAFFGHMKNYFSKELHFSENVVTENIGSDEEGLDNAFDDTAYSLIDQKDYNEWLELEYSSSYSKFIEATGGIKEVLSDDQLKIVTMTNMMPQKAVAEELGVSESNITQTLDRADKRLKKAYTSWRTAEIMSNSGENDLTDIIKSFLHQFDKIAEVDVDDTFDYFTYIVNFIKENSSDRDFEYDYDFMQSNKLDISLTVVDVIGNYIKKSQFDSVTDVLQAHVRGLDEDKAYTKRQKERFSKAVVSAMYRYLENVEGNINEFLDVAIDTFATRNNEKMGRVKNDDYKSLNDLLDK